MSDVMDYIKNLLAQNAQPPGTDSSVMDTESDPADAPMKPIQIDTSTPTPAVGMGDVHAATDPQTSGLARNLGMIGSSIDPSSQVSQSTTPTPVAMDAKPATRSPAIDSDDADDSKSTTPKTDKEVVEDYLRKKFGMDGMGQDALDAAQKQRDQGLQSANQAQALATIAAGASMNPNVKPNEDFYNRLRSQATIPIQNLEEKQNLQGKLLSNEKGVDALEQEKAANDPTSTVSKAAQKMYGGMLSGALKGMGMDPALVQNLSAAQIQEGISDPTKLLVQLKDTQVKAQEAMMMKQMMIGQHNDQIQNAAKADAANALEKLKSRGTVSHAYEANRRAANIASLLNRYPNPDDMPPDQVNLLKEEVSGMINGGAPTVQGAQGIISPTAGSKLSEFAQYLGNAKSGAGLSGKINQYKPYISDVVGNSNKVIQDAQNSLLSGYSRKARPEDLTDLKTQFQNELTSPQMFQPRAPQTTNPAAAPHAQPKIVIQNGHTYTLNPSTGRYE